MGAWGRQRRVSPRLWAGPTGCPARLSRALVLLAVVGLAGAATGAAAGGSVRAATSQELLDALLDQSVTSIELTQDVELDSEWNRGECPYRGRGVADGGAGPACPGQALLRL